MALAIYVCFLLTTFLIICIVSEGAVNTTSTAGKEFVFAFIGWVPQRRYFVTINTLQESPVQGVLTIPGTDITEEFSVSKNDRKVIIWGDEDRSRDVAYQPIYINATGDIFVHGQTTNFGQLADGFCVLPTSSLGTHYHLVSQVPGCSEGEFLVVSLGDGQTEVTLSNWPAGYEDPVNVILGPYERYYYKTRGWGDMTGLKVNSTKPVAVISGLLCGRVPMFGNLLNAGPCELLVEMIPDVESYGKYFVMTSIYPRTSGFEYRVIASQDDTTFSITSSFDDSVVTKSINAGEFYIGDTTAEHETIVIRAAKPVLVAQYAKDVQPMAGIADGVSGPHILIVPSVEHWSGDGGFVQYNAGNWAYRVSITSSCCDHDGFLIDGQPLQDLTGTVDYIYDNMCTTQLELPAGFTMQHTIEHVNGSKFFAYVYGTHTVFSYAYPVSYNVHVIHDEQDLPSLSQAPIVGLVQHDQVFVSWQSWGSNELDSGNGPLFEYQIDYRDISKDIWISAGVLPVEYNCDVTLTSYGYTVASLESGRYEFCVRAVAMSDRVGPRSPVSVAVEIINPTTTMSSTTVGVLTDKIATTALTEQNLETVQTKTETKVATLPPTVDISVQGSVGLDRTYSLSLSNPGSDDYKQLESEFIAGMTIILQTRYGNARDIQIRVIGFSQGSVLVNYVINFMNVATDPTMGEAQMMTTTKEEVLVLLRNTVSDGYLHSLPIVADSVQIWNAHTVHDMLINTEAPAVALMVMKDKLMNLAAKNSLISVGSVIGFIAIIIACFCVYKRSGKASQKPWHDQTYLNQTANRRFLNRLPKTDFIGRRLSLMLPELDGQEVVTVDDVRNGHGEFEIVGMSADGRGIRGTIQVLPKFKNQPCQLVPNAATARPTDAVPSKQSSSESSFDDSDYDQNSVNVRMKKLKVLDNDEFDHISQDSLSVSNAFGEDDDTSV